MFGIPLIILTALSPPPCDSIVVKPQLAELPESMTNSKSCNIYKFFAAKTNAVLWAAAVMNVECELQIAHSFSISIPVWWSPYFVSQKLALRILAIQPEFRYWLNRPGYGSFFGIHPGIAWYNLRHNDIRYQDSGLPLVDIGISYGYSLRINQSFNMEFSIGGGFIKTKFDRFYNIDNGAKIDTRQTTYCGIDRFEISLVYHFDL